MSNLPSEATNPTIDLRSDDRDGVTPVSAVTGSAWADHAQPPSIPRPRPAAFTTFRVELTKPWVLLFFGIHGLLVLLFVLAPEIDLWFSRLFYIAGEGFNLIGTQSSTKALPFLPWISTVLVTALLFELARNFVAWRRNRQSISRLLSIRRILFLLLTLGLGPGLLINLVLKHQSGRSRPYLVQAFGGEKKFTPVFTAATQCPNNCSFVSGDAAMGYYLLAFLFVVRKRRWAIVVTGFSLGTGFGLIRILQGKHFLSDVIFAEFFTLLIAWILYLLILRPEEDSPALLAPNFFPGVNAEPEHRTGDAPPTDSPVQFTSDHRREF